MAEINVDIDEQIGGFRSLRIIAVDEIVNCPDVLTNDNAIYFTSTPALDTIDATMVSESIALTSKPTRNRSGILHRINASFDMASQSSLLDDYLNDRTANGVVLVAEKHYGQQILYGSKNYPLKLLYENIHGKKQEEGTTVRVRISAKIPQKPVFVTD